MQTTNMLHLFD